LDSLSSVSSQFIRLTDRQTNGRTAAVDGRSRLHCNGGWWCQPTALSLRHVVITYIVQYYYLSTLINPRSCDASKNTKHLSLFSEFDISL